MAELRVVLVSQEEEGDPLVEEEFDVFIFESSGVSFAGGFHADLSLLKEFLGMDTILVQSGDKTRLKILANLSEVKERLLQRGHRVHVEDRTM
jgi:hypothetical protein